MLILKSEEGAQNAMRVPLVAVRLLQTTAGVEVTAEVQSVAGFASSI